MLALGLAGTACASGGSVQGSAGSQDDTPIDGSASDGGVPEGSVADDGGGSDGGASSDALLQYEQSNQDDAADSGGEGCQGLTSLCGGACVQYTTGANCGSCGMACTGSTPVCAGAAGVYSCVSGCPSVAPMICNGGCVDFATPTTAAAAGPRSPAPRVRRAVRAGAPGGRRTREPTPETVARQTRSSSARVRPFAQGAAFRTRASSAAPVPRRARTQRCTAPASSPARSSAGATRPAKTLRSTARRPRRVPSRAPGRTHARARRSTATAKRVRPRAADQVRACGRGTAWARAIAPRTDASRHRAARGRARRPWYRGSCACMRRQVFSSGHWPPLR